jgi:hypothetical protein
MLKASNATYVEENTHAKLETIFQYSPGGTEEYREKLVRTDGLRVKIRVQDFPDTKLMI